MAAGRECAGTHVASFGTARKGAAMNDSDFFFEQRQWLAEAEATARKIRELLETLEADWGEQAAERALAIVTGDAT